MLVNAERLAALRAEIGEDGFEEVLEMFLKESDEVVARLAAPSIPESIEADLHFLKGTALTLGMDDLADMCRRGEQGAAVDPAALADLYRRSCAALPALA
ncbi:Hpt domain-containing protein [Tabrizicola sp. M-4]|uniref:Hpt domain-containing protein n=1 Tax=Tabrizicola sp. M-4 TaxID=3055847 RepID=UPI003DA7BBBD